MSTYYYKGAVIAAPFTIESNEPYFESDTLSLKHQRTAQGAQRWELSFSVITRDYVTMFIDTVDETNLAETMIMPQLPPVEDLLTASGTLPVNGTPVVGQKAINVLVDTASGLIPKGYFIKFSDHDKLYLVTSDCVLNGTGVQTLNIYPGLQFATTGNVLTGSSALFSYYRDT